MSVPAAAFSAQNIRRIAWALIIAGLLVKLMAVFVAVVHPDSNLFLNTADNFMRRGGITPYMWRIDPAANIVSGSGAGYGILLQIGWFRVFGITVLAGHLLSYLASVGSLILVYLTARRWWDADSALFAAAYMAVSTMFFDNMTIRMDALATLAYSAVLLLHITAVQRDRWWLHFLTGVGVIACAEFHIIALVLVAGLTFYYGIDALIVIWRERRLRVRPAWFYFAGALVAGVAYLVVRVLPNPYEYFFISSTCEICVRPGLLAEFVRYVTLLVQTPFDLLLIIIALVAAVRRGTERDQHYALILGGCMVGMGVASPPPTFSQYYGHIIPVIALGVGAFFARGAALGTTTPLLNPRRLGFGLFVGCALLIVNAGVMIVDRVQTGADDPRIAYIRTHIPMDTVVSSRPVQYHNLIEYYNFISYDDGEQFGTALRNEPYADFLERERPLVILGDYPTPESQPELWAYMQAHDFEEVMPRLWLHPSMVEVRNQGVDSGA